MTGQRDYGIPNQKTKHVILTAAGSHKKNRESSSARGGMNS